MKSISLLLNLIFCLIFAVLFFIPKKSTVKQITKPNNKEIKRLELVIKDLVAQARQDSIEKIRYICLADSLQKARKTIQYVIKKQNEKIDSIQNLPIVLPDTSLIRILSEFETTPKK